MRKNIVLRHLGSQEPIHTSTHSALWVRGTWYHLLVCPVASWDGWRGCYFLASSCSLSHGRWGEAEEGPPLLPPTLAGSGLQCLGLVAVARGPGLVLWDICTAVMKLLLSPLLSPLRLNPGGMRFLGYRSYPPPPPAPAPGGSRYAPPCVFQQGAPVGWPAGPLPAEGSGCMAQSHRGCCQVSRKYLRQRDHAGPHALAPSPLLALRPAVLIWAGAGLSVLAESSHWSPFWHGIGHAFQDHILDAGTEIWEG